MKPNKTVREDVVKFLVKQMLQSIDGCGVDALSVAELTSAAFTLTNHVASILLEQTEGPEHEHNVEQITNGVGQLYQLVKPTRTH